MLETNIKAHELTCDECRELSKDEKLDKALNHVIEHRFRNMIKEEWQTSVEITQKIDKMYKIIFWMILAHVFQMLFLGGILILILTKKPL